MAKPRIFVSSTYYDLKHIRSDIERFIKDQGFDPILNERGHIPYGNKEKLEEYCYKEINLCDILVAVVGGRFGSESKDEDYSISNLELKTAIDKGKQVYIFVEDAVQAEYRTYEANKENPETNYASVDDVRVYTFLEEVYSLPINNQIKGFGSFADISSYLKLQWAGLFQSLLHENARRQEVDLVADLKDTSSTLKSLVNYLVAEKGKGDQAVKNILMNNHSAFDTIKRLLKIPYRVFFENHDELTALLNVRQFEAEDMIFGDDWSIKDHMSWKRNGSKIYLRVSNEIFEDGILKAYTPGEWNPQWIRIEDLEEPLF